MYSSIKLAVSKTECVVLFLRGAVLRRKIHIHCKQCKNAIYVLISLIAHIHCTLIKAFGCVTGMIEFLCLKHQLPSMTSKRSNLGKHLMVLLVLQSNNEIRYKEIIG